MLNKFEIPSGSYRYRLHFKSSDTVVKQAHEVKERHPRQKLLVLIGESTSGKSTLINELTKRFPDKFERVTTCTSRKPRAGEENGVDYHFLPKEYFRSNPGLVIVVESANGDLYGTRMTDLFSEQKHMLLPSVPEGVEELVKLGFTNLVVVQMHVSEEEKVRRMCERGESDEQIEKRVARERSFQKLKDVPGTEVINIDSEDLTPEDALQLVLNLLENK